jgi:hypothetical protein
MKSKKIGKKLELSKTTISNLNSNEMNTVIVGVMVESQRTDLCHSVCNSACPHCYTVDITCIPPAGE